MAFLDLTGELLGKVDFEKSRIIQPRKLVFVCGGMKSGNPAAATSMREVLLARAADGGKAGELGGVQVILAEAAVNYLAESAFTNLLDLERHISAVVHAVVLIVESPGSMCELGAFVMAKEIRNKLIIVMQSEHMPRPSFITSGAVKYFKEKEGVDRLLGFQWGIDPTTRVIAVDDEVVDEMLSSLSDAMDAVHARHATEAFKRDLDGHRIILTLAFCHLLRAAKQADIKKCFDLANIKVTETEIKCYFDILVICELVKIVQHGKLAHYVAAVEEMPFEIAFREGTPGKDRSTSRWITRIKDAIEADKEEKYRLGIFKRARHG